MCVCVCFIRPPDVNRPESSRLDALLCFNFLLQLVCVAADKGGCHAKFTHLSVGRVLERVAERAGQTRDADREQRNASASANTKASATSPAETRRYICKQMELLEGTDLYDDLRCDLVMVKVIEERRRRQ